MLLLHLAALFAFAFAATGPPVICSDAYSDMTVQELAKEAADYGLIYGLEVVNRYETNILNVAQQVRQMVGHTV